MGPQCFRIYDDLFKPDGDLTDSTFMILGLVAPVKDDLGFGNPGIEIEEVMVFDTPFFFFLLGADFLVEPFVESPLLPLECRCELLRLGTFAPAGVDYLEA